MDLFSFIVSMPYQYAAYLLGYGIMLRIGLYVNDRKRKGRS